MMVRRKRKEKAMSAPVTTATAWQWPADVLTFATEQQVDIYLDPLLEATHRLFLTALGLKVFVAVDPEIRDFRQIVFHVKVPQRDVPNFVEAVHRWTDELYRHCPAPWVCNFCLILERTA
jgi:hypothetical protein